MAYPDYPYNNPTANREGGPADKAADAAAAEAALEAEYKNVGEAIANNELPWRLRADPALNGGSLADLNDATDNGWYLSQDIAANAPAAMWGNVFVESPDNNVRTQTWHPAENTNDGADTNLWRRHFYYGTTWGAWYRLRVSEAELDARYPTDRGYWVGDFDALTQAGHYRVENLGGDVQYVNEPVGAYGYGLVVVSEVEGTVSQVYYPHNTTKREGPWHRIRWGGGEWTPWSVSANGDDSGWIEVGSTGAPAFLNGWTNYDVWHPSARFRKIGNRVQLEGLIKNGTVAPNDTGDAFYLPEGFRPTKHLHFAVTGGGLFACAYVMSTSAVRIENGNNAYISLNGISFLVD